MEDRGGLRDNLDKPHVTASGRALRTLEHCSTSPPPSIFPPGDLQATAPADISPPQGPCRTRTKPKVTHTFQTKPPSPPHVSEGALNGGREGGQGVLVKHQPCEVSNGKGEETEKRTRKHHVLRFHNTPESQRTPESLGSPQPHGQLPHLERTDFGIPQMRVKPLLQHIPRCDLGVGGVHEPL